MAATPASAAAKWATNLSAAATNGTIQQGIAGVTVAPGQAAARQKTVWVQNVTASQDKWATNVANVSLQSWQSDTVSKGLPRIASGATAAQPKMQAFMTQALPYIQNAVASLPARGNFTQNLARMNAMATAMHNFTYNKSGS